MDDEIERAIKSAADDTPRIPGVDWSIALSVAMLRVLEERMPGFRDAVRARVHKSAEAMEKSDDLEWQEDAPSMRELADSWIFTETPSAESG
jgi:hypothetical protein